MALSEGESLCHVYWDVSTNFLDLDDSMHVCRWVDAEAEGKKTGVILLMDCRCVLG